MNPPFHYSDFDSEFVGVDETKGRFGEVTIETCKHCGRKWLRYFVEYEAFSESGRWYRGLVTPENQQSLKPEEALGLLGRLPWYFYGGSYFRTTGEKCKGSGIIDL